MIIRLGLQGILAGLLTLMLLACAHTTGDDFFAVDRYEAAADLYIQSAENGDLQKMLRLAEMYASGKIDYHRDYVKAAYWYRKAAEMGHVPAMYELAFIYEYGQGEVEQDLEQAVYWYRRAGEQGDAYSRYRLGGVLSQLEPVDPVAAMQWLLLADEAAQGCPEQATCQIVLEDMFNIKWALQKTMTNEQIALARQHARDWQPPLPAP